MHGSIPMWALWVMVHWYWVLGLTVATVAAGLFALFAIRRRHEN